MKLKSQAKERKQKAQMYEEAGQKGTGMKENKNGEEHRYDDIIELPHHVSKTRARMSLYERAAQFSPYAALSEHGPAIKKTAMEAENKAFYEDIRLTRGKE